MHYFECHWEWIQLQKYCNSFNLVFNNNQSFKVSSMPLLISHLTRDIADFAYLQFSGSGCMLLMNFVSAQYVWRNIITRLRNDILCWHEGRLFREQEKEKTKRDPSRIRESARCLRICEVRTHQVRLRSTSNAIYFFRYWNLKKLGQLWYMKTTTIIDKKKSFEQDLRHFEFGGWNCNKMGWSNRENPLWMLPCCRPQR